MRGGARHGREDGPTPGSAHSPGPLETSLMPWSRLGGSSARRASLAAWLTCRSDLRWDGAIRPVVDRKNDSCSTSVLQKAQYDAGIEGDAAGHQSRSPGCSEIEHHQLIR